MKNPSECDMTNAPSSLIDVQNDLHAKVVRRLNMVDDESATQIPGTGPAGTAGRDQFDARLAIEMTTSQHTARPLCCLVVHINGSQPDVTGLEPIHAIRLVGDFSRFLVEVCRGDHVICNYEAGRFAILLPGAGRGTAIRFADRLSILIRGRAWKIADCQVDLLCSIGVSQQVSPYDPNLFLRASQAADRATHTRQLVSIAA
jgi:PleD family two-component response regulator